MDEVGAEPSPGPLPAWERRTAGEQRWPASLAVAVAIVLQLLVDQYYAFRPYWLLPALGGVLLVAVTAANPSRVDRTDARIRGASIALIVVMSLANAGSAARLVIALISGTAGDDATPVLLSGAAVWLTNVLVFALWYWELDRGGPAARAHGVRPYPDLLFPQMTAKDMTPPDWEPRFMDYLYTSFTNATAFSPTDVMPLARWTKATMLVQSAVSLAVVALVIARAVNILH